MDLSNTQRKLLVFSGAVGLTTFVVMMVGWYTDLRQVAYVTLMTLAVIALFPLLIVVSGILLSLVLLGASIVVAIVTEGETMDGGAGVGFELSTHSAKFVGPYYRFLARQEHPVFWGIPVGLLFGGLLLWGTISVIIVSDEARTIEILAQTQTQIEDYYNKQGRFPAANEKGRLSLESLGIGSGHQEFVTDGFGRPLRYDLKGKWKFASYTLRSFGFDPAGDHDDLCVSGATELAQKSEKFKKRALAFLSDLKQQRDIPFADKLWSIQLLRCTPDKSQVD